MAAQGISGRWNATLALDLMEEHRAALVDRLVVSLLSRRALTPSMFELHTGLDGLTGVRLTAEGRRIYLTAFSERLTARVTGGQRQVDSYRDLITLQVRAFAHALRTDAEYRAAFLK